MQKNKLLLTTALAGSLMVATAQAEIGGNIETVVAFGSDERAGADNNGSGTRIGSEMNFTYKKKHELDNGMYVQAAGKLEIDDSGSSQGTNAQQAALSGAPGDHEYEVQIGSGNFYIGLGSDAGSANVAATALPLVAGEYPGTAASQIGTNSSDFVDLMTTSPGSGGKEANDKTHISFNAKVAGGVAGITYAPKTGEQDDDTDNVDDTTGGSRLAFAYVGKPMDGLKVVIGQSTEKGDTDSTAGSEFENQKIGVSYTFGQFTGAVERQTFENDTKTTDQKGMAYELAYAVSDNLTLGAAYAVSEDDVTANAAEEKIKSLSIGYSLGAVGFTAAYVDVTDTGFTSGNDQKGVFIRTTTKF